MVYGVGMIVEERTPERLAGQMAGMVEKGRQGHWLEALEKTAEELCWEREVKQYMKVLEKSMKKLDFYPGKALDWGSFHIYFLGAILKTLSITGIIDINSREYYKDHLNKADVLYIIGRLLSVAAGMGLF